MRARDKKIVQSNHSLDKYLAPKAPHATTQHNKHKIKVPPCSGLFPQHPPTSNILKYPRKPEIRQYQLDIVCTCAHSNTLVCLPTGLGKTHIAAVLIANFLNWFPDKKALFLAPTRPLVRQQVSALKTVRDQVPREWVLEVSGQLHAKKREQLYEAFRIIFGTPQTIENDIKTGKLDKNKIILLIFDQCHRSVGEASYAKVVRLLSDIKTGFRIVGLSATPGYEAEKVQNVISSLNIARVIYKDEKDADVKRYLNEKTIFEIQVKGGDVIREICQILQGFAKPSLSLLLRMNLVSPWLVKNGIKSTSFFAIREQFLKKVQPLKFKQKSLAYAALGIVRFFIDSRKSIIQRGFQTFRRTFFDPLNSVAPKCSTNKEAESDSLPKSQTKIQNYLQQDSKTDFSKSFIDIENDQSISLLHSKQTSNATSQNNSQPTLKLPAKFQSKLVESEQYRRLHQLFFERKACLHPKLQKLIDILKQFYKQGTGKAIIFTNYRVTAKEIHQYLQPITEIRAEMFFGQSKTVFQEEGEESSVICLKQKDQIRIIQRFKKGEINTLISTSIGEEGLDIGEVDCIVCYDGGHSPIRSIQRRGRTGRKRAGSIYFLLMEGKEWADYKNGLKKETKMKNMLTKDLHKFQYYPYNSTLFQEKSYIEVEEYDNLIEVEEVAEPQEKVSKPTKIKIRKSRGEEKQKQEQKQTKTKKRRGRPKKGNSLGQTNSQQSLSQQEIEIKCTTINDLLGRYSESEGEDKEQIQHAASQNDQDSQLSQNLEKGQQTILQQSFQDENSQHSCRLMPNQDRVEQAGERRECQGKGRVGNYSQTQQTKAGQGQQQERQFKAVEAQLTPAQCLQSELAGQEEVDELQQQFLQYKLNQQTKLTNQSNFIQQPSLIYQANLTEQTNAERGCSSDQESLSSSQFFQRMQKVKSRRELYASLLESDEEQA